MDNLVYEATTKDGKEIKIYEDGTCDGDFEFKYCFNHFTPYIYAQVGKEMMKLKKALSDLIANFGLTQQ